jgi:hypothetical protein
MIKGQKKNNKGKKAAKRDKKNDMTISFLRCFASLQDIYFEFLEIPLYDVTTQVPKGPFGISSSP